MDKEIQDIYQVSVLDDIKNIGELSHPVRAGLLERLVVRHASLKRLHPNPVDEFSDPNIGPNYEIVGKYRQEYVRCRKYHIKPTTDPLTVEKLSTGGYRLLNGHHRWMAMKMINMKRSRVQVVNTIPATKIISAVQKSDNSMCVSFDLDEVLRCEGKGVDADKGLGFPFNLIYREKIRANVGACITELRKLGFDIWIYTGSYLSRDHIDGLLKHHKAKVTGIMNGLKTKKPDSRITQAFKEKYNVMVHVDNESIIWVNTRTKDFDDISISSGSDWANEVYSKIKERLQREGSK